MLNTSQDNSLRKVAILVASLDETWGNQVLASLTPQQARNVRQQVELLTEIDPEEQHEIVEEFRRRLAQPTNNKSDGVELDASLLERIDHGNYSTTTAAEQKPFEALSATDTDFLVEMLAGESAQTIAVVLAKLEADRAAEILDQFPVSQQHDILTRLAELDATDEHSIQLVEAQVSQWIGKQRERRRRMAAGKEMVDRIVSRTAQRRPEPASQNTVVAARLSQPTSRIAKEYLGTSSTSLRRPTSQSVRHEPIPRVAEPIAPVNAFSDLDATECLNRLESLPDEELMTALSRCEAQVVSLAMVGASEKLLKRILRGLPRGIARQFRRQLRDIGPTRISDILTAQQEILHTAAQLT